MAETRDKHEKDVTGIKVQHLRAKEVWTKEANRLRRQSGGAW